MSEWKELDAGQQNQPDGRQSEKHVLHGVPGVIAGVPSRSGP